MSSTDQDGCSSRCFEVFFSSVDPSEERLVLQILGSPRTSPDREHAWFFEARWNPVKWSLELETYPCHHVNWSHVAFVQFCTRVASVSEATKLQSKKLDLWTLWRETWKNTTRKLDTKYTTITGKFLHSWGKRCAMGVGQVHVRWRWGNLPRRVV